MSDVSKSKAKYEGKVFASTNSGDFKVVEYIDQKNVVVEFLYTGTRLVARIGNILNGGSKGSDVSVRLRGRDNRGEDTCCRW